MTAGAPAPRATAAHRHLPPGSQLGDLRIKSVLGSGGSAVTYHALDQRSGREVALKEYFPRSWAARRIDGIVVPATDEHAPLFASGLDRFIAEAEFLTRFQQPGIVRVERVFAALGTGYMQLAYIAGPTLAHWLAQPKPAPTQDEIDGFANVLASSLETIHSAGILHCDISPRNIILSRNGLPILIDFGSARSALAQQAQEPAILVTPHYSPQEIYNSSGALRGPWSDIFAASAVLHTLVLGAPPTPAPERALGASKIMLAQVQQSDGYRRNFLTAIDWGLAFKPTKRPQSVAQWAAMLLPAERHKLPARGLTVGASASLRNRP